jgi:hypothetical protein
MGHMDLDIEDERRETEDLGDREATTRCLNTSPFPLAPRSPFSGRDSIQCYYPSLTTLSSTVQHTQERPSHRPMRPPNFARGELHPQRVRRCMHQMALVEGHACGFSPCR